MRNNSQSRLLQEFQPEKSDDYNIQSELVLGPGPQVQVQVIWSPGPDPGPGPGPGPGIPWNSRAGILWFCQQHQIQYKLDRLGFLW